MNQKYQIDEILFLDIETVPQEHDFSQLNEETQALWQIKADQLQARTLEEAQTPEDYYERAGIYAEFGKIICISVGYVAKKKGQLQLRVKSFAGDDEHTILAQFSELLANTHPSRFTALCAHNGREFDFPYLCRRLLINSMPLPRCLAINGKKPWELNHLLDTMQLWKFGDYKHFTSLRMLANVFGIPSPKDDISGSDVSKVYYEEKDLNRIIQYCQKDVATLAKVYARLMLETLDFEEIVVEEVE
ncbi:MAG: 3'-5' exonuclease [Bacteroidetes bacterium]|nr:3'-5' exonuclease [Bacteroidota bacterium]